MSWHYLQGQEAASWAGTSLDGAPSALSSMIPTPAASSSPGNATDAFHDSPSGMTSEPSTDTHGADTLTSFPEGFPARTSAQPEGARESTGHAPGCGVKWRESSARFDLASCGWKTHRSLFPEDLPWSSVTLPKWGMMQGGVLWERITPEPRTNETDAGCWPTPRVTGLDGGSNSRKAAMRRGMWPTPRAGKTTSESAESWIARNKDGKVATPPLGLAVRMPTPSANDWKGSSQPGQRRGQLTDPAMGVIEAGGQLNPNWVEWLMGWPLGWTSTEPMPESTWAAWQRAFQSEFIACGASATGRCPQP